MNETVIPIPRASLAEQNHSFWRTKSSGFGYDVMGFTHRTEDRSSACQTEKLHHSLMILILQGNMNNTNSSLFALKVYILPFLFCSMEQYVKNEWD